MDPGLFVTLPVDVEHGAVSALGIVFSTAPDTSARLSVLPVDADGTARKETWEVPAGTTFAEVMARCHRLLSEE